MQARVLCPNHHSELPPDLSDQDSLCQHASHRGLQILENISFSNLGHPGVSCSKHHLPVTLLPDLRDACDQDHPSLFDFRDLQAEDTAAQAHARHYPRPSFHSAGLYRHSCRGESLEAGGRGHLGVPCVVYGCQYVSPGPQDSNGLLHTCHLFPSTTVLHLEESADTSAPLDSQAEKDALADIFERIFLSLPVRLRVRRWDTLHVLRDRFRYKVQGFLTDKQVPGRPVLRLFHGLGDPLPLQVPLIE